MVVNNLSAIYQLMDFSAEGYFYWGQVIKRRKENPDMVNNSSIIRDYFFDCPASWIRRIERMIGDCVTHNARAYINLNRRSYEAVGLRTLQLLAGYAVTKDYVAMRSAYQSACGKTNSEPNRKWLIDIDGPGDETDFAMLADFKVLASLPTKNGRHLIVAPFDSRAMPGLGIKRDSPTLAYCP